METITGLAIFYCVLYAGACALKKENPVAAAARGLAFTVAGLFALGFAAAFMVGFAEGFYGY